MHKKKVYLRMAMSAINIRNPETVTELEEIVQSIIEMANCELILQLCYGNLEAISDFITTQGQEHTLIEFPSTETQEQGLTHSFLSAIETNSRIFGILSPVINRITGMGILSSRLDLEKVAMIATLTPQASVPTLKHLTLTMPSNYCNEFLEYPVGDLADKILHLHINALSPAPNTIIGGARLSLLQNLLELVEGRNNLELRTIALSHYDEQEPIERSIEEISRITRTLKQEKVKLSIKNAKILIKAFEQQAINTLPKFIAANNELLKFLLQLIDSEVQIDLGINRNIWETYLEKEHFSKILKEAGEAGGNDILLAGTQHRVGHHLSTNIRTFLEEAENGIEELSDGCSYILRDLYLLAEIAEIRDFQNALEKINYLLEQEQLIRLGGTGHGNVYYNGHLMPEEVLRNIISFLPRELGIENNNFTKEQMDAIAAKIIKAPLRYLEALDVTKIVSGVQMANAINEAILSHQEKYGDEKPFALPILITDIPVEQRWLLYFQTGSRAENSAQGFFIDPLLKFNEKGKLSLGFVIFELYLMDVAEQGPVPIIFVGTQSINDNSGAWVMYFIEELQNKLSDIDDLSSVSLDSSWAMDVLNNGVQPDTYPDIEELTNRYEGYTEELMDMGDGGAYYREMGIANNSSLAEENEEPTSEGLHPSFQSLSPDSYL